MARRQIAQTGKVIAFVPPPNRLRKGPETGDGERGVVLLFTGVRYERLAGSAPLPTGPDRHSHAGA